MFHLHHFTQKSSFRFYLFTFFLQKKNIPFTLTKMTFYNPKSHNSEDKDIVVENTQFSQQNSTDFMDQDKETNPNTIIDEKENEIETQHEEENEDENDEDENEDIDEDENEDIDEDENEDIDEDENEENDKSESESENENENENNNKREKSVDEEGDENMNKENENHHEFPDANSQLPAKTVINIDKKEKEIKEAEDKKKMIERQEREQVILNAIQGNEYMAGGLSWFTRSPLFPYPQLPHHSTASTIQRQEAEILTKATTILINALRESGHHINTQKYEDAWKSIDKTNTNEILHMIIHIVHDVTNIIENSYEMNTQNNSAIWFNYGALYGQLETIIDNIIQSHKISLKQLLDPNAKKSQDMDMDIDIVIIN